MFAWSEFNQDIGRWDTGRVKNMKYMFYGSQFDRPIGDWNTANVITMEAMFMNSQFNQDISRWNTSRLKYIRQMFSDSKFRGDVSRWCVKKLSKTKMECIFSDEYDVNLYTWVSQRPDIEWNNYIKPELLHYFGEKWIEYECRKSKN
jgi:hypothetical protein